MIMDLESQSLQLQHSTSSIVTLENYNYVKAATSANTRKAYQTDILHFMRWGGLLPASADMIVSYLQTFASQLNPRTLQRRVTALKNWHVYQNFSDPTAHPLVRKTLIGIQNIHGKPKDKAPPLQLDTLQTMIKYLNNSERPINLRNSALLLIGFFGAFRRSELCAIKFEDIKFAKQGIEISIPRSKTDQISLGQSCAIPYVAEGLCAVSSLKAWCETAQIHEGYIFRRIKKNGLISHEPIKAEHINIILKELARKCALPNYEDYSSHSLRRGFATAASQSGASLISIMRQGRWQHADTALGYIEEAKAFEDNAVDSIFKTNI